MTSVFDFPSNSELCKASAHWVNKYVPVAEEGLCGAQSRAELNRYEFKKGIGS